MNMKVASNLTCIFTQIRCTIVAGDDIYVYCLHGASFYTMGYTNFQNSAFQLSSEPDLILLPHYISPYLFRCSGT